MKIILVRPPLEVKLTYKPQPMSLACLAGFLKRHLAGLEIEIIDAAASHLTWQETAAKIEEKKPNILGLTIKTPQALNAGKITGEIRKKLPHTYIIHGGNHVTALPEESIQAGAHMAVVGEGERTFLEIVQALLKRQADWRTVKGIYYRDKHNISYTGRRELMRIDDLKDGPDWSFLNLGLYNENIHIHSEPTIQVMGSRGCPHHCTFCSTTLTWSEQVRFRHPEDVVDELEKDIEYYNFHCFHFYDDDIILDPAWLLRVAELIIEKNLDIQWHGIARADSLIRAKHILPTLKKSGFMGFALGFESGVDTIYQKQNKKMLLNDLTKSIFILRDMKFPIIELLLMNCYPGETISAMIKSAGFLLDLKNIHQVPFHTSRYFATPFPGTGFHQTAKDDGLLLARHYGEHFCHHVTFLPNSFLESRVNQLAWDEAVYPYLYRLGFFSNGEYSDFLDPLEAKDFMNSLDSTELFSMFNRELKHAASFADFVKNIVTITGLSERFCTELTCKLMIHAASYGMLYEDTLGGRTK